MLLISKWLFALLVLCGIAGLLGVGVSGYHALAAPPTDADELRLAGETLLFVAFLTAGVLLLGGAVVIFRGREILKELSRVAEVARTGASAVDERLRRLGPLGERVRRILLHATELNRRYSLKVSTLSALNDFLLNNSAQKMILVDASGAVIAASRGYRDNAGNGAAKLIGRNIVDLVEGLNFTSIYGRLERERVPLTASDDPELHFVPITNRAGEVACVVCVLGTKPLLNEIPASVPAAGKRLSFVDRLLRRRERG